MKESDKPTEAMAISPDAAPPAPAVTSPVTNSETLKDKRRSSFFDTISGRKDKKPDGTSESEATDGEGKKPNKLQGLLRKASRSAKPAHSPVINSSTPPAPPAKDGEVPTVGGSVPTSDGIQSTKEPKTATTGETEEPVTSVEVPTTTKTSAPATVSA